MTTHVQQPELAYLPALITSLKTHYSSIDARIFTAIFLSLIAGEQNLILRTQDEDVASVASLAIDVRASSHRIPLFALKRAGCIDHDGHIWSSISPRTGAEIRGPFIVLEVPYVPLPIE
jgi:hypothetical protein